MSPQYPVQFKGSSFARGLLGLAGWLVSGPVAHWLLGAALLTLMGHSAQALVTRIVIDETVPMPASPQAAAKASAASISRGLWICCEKSGGATGSAIKCAPPAKWHQQHADLPKSGLNAANRALPNPQ